MKRISEKVLKKLFSKKNNKPIPKKDNSPFVTSVLLKIIKGDIPSYCIKKFICYNNNAKEKLEN